MIEKIILAVISIGYLISLIANYFRPIDPNLGGEGTFQFNIGVEKYQPLFIDKLGGITYMILAKPKYNSASKILERLDFKVNKLSGLLTVKIDQVHFNPTARKLEMTIVQSFNSYAVPSEVSFPIPNEYTLIPFTTKVTRALLIWKARTIEYQDPSIGMTGIQGRICNFDCLHET